MPISSGTSKGAFELNLDSAPTISGTGRSDLSGERNFGSTMKIRLPVLTIKRGNMYVEKIKSTTSISNRSEQYIIITASEIENGNHYIDMENGILEVVKEMIERSPELSQRWELKEKNGSSDDDFGSTRSNDHHDYHLHNVNAHDDSSGDEDDDDDDDMAIADDEDFHRRLMSVAD